MDEENKMELLDMPTSYCRSVLGFAGNRSESEDWLTDGHALFKFASVATCDELDDFRVEGASRVNLTAIEKLWSAGEKEPLRPAFFLGCIPQKLPLAYAAIRFGPGPVMWVNAYKLAFLTVLLRPDSLAVVDSDEWLHGALRLRRAGETVAILMPIRPGRVRVGCYLPENVYDLSAAPLDISDYVELDWADADG